jgi:hypothetical protein
MKAIADILRDAAEKIEKVTAAADNKPTPTRDDLAMRIYDCRFADLKAPEGFELTGEVRSVQPGDWFLSRSRTVFQATVTIAGVYRAILRKLPTEPSFAERVEALYGVPFERLAPPMGWEFTKELRAPKCGEYYLARTAPKSLRAGGQWEDTPAEHRLILRPKLTPALVRRWVFEETGETRPPKKGEWFRSISGSIASADCNWSHYVPSDLRPILRLVEKPKEA